MKLPEKGDSGLKQWSLVGQNQHHLGTCWKRKLIGPQPRPIHSEVLGAGPSSLFLALSGDCYRHQNLRIHRIQERHYRYQVPRNFSTSGERQTSRERNPLQDFLFMLRGVACNVWGYHTFSFVSMSVIFQQH